MISVNSSLGPLHGHAIGNTCKLIFGCGNFIFQSPKIVDCPLERQLAAHWSYAITMQDRKLTFSGHHNKLPNVKKFNLSGNQNIVWKQHFHTSSLFIYIQHHIGIFQKPSGLKILMEIPNFPLKSITFNIGCSLVTVMVGSEMLQETA